MRFIYGTDSAAALAHARVAGWSLHAVFFIFLSLTSIYLQPSGSWLAISLLNILLSAFLLFYHFTGDGLRNALIHVTLAYSLVVIAFLEMAILVPKFNHRNFSKLFLRIDRTIFPSLSLMSFKLSILADLLQVSYALYYFAPLALIASLAVRRNNLAIHKAVLLHSSAFYTSFVIYFLFPAQSPYRIATGSPILNELIYTQWLRDIIHRLEVFNFDSFPSGHVLVGAVTVFCVYRWSRELMPYFVTWFILQLFATFLLGYHYLIDILAALILAPIIIVPIIRLTGPNAGIIANEIAHEEDL